MGTKPSDTLKEIESIRSGLDGKLSELERRLPAVAQLGRRALALAVGGGAGGTALWFVVRRLRPKKADRKAAPPAPVTVKVFPAGTLPAAIGIAAVWAGVRIFEAKLRGGRPQETPKLAPVRPIAQEGT